MYVCTLCIRAVCAAFYQLAAKEGEQRIERDGKQ